MRRFLLTLIAAGILAGSSTAYAEKGIGMRFTFSPWGKIDPTTAKGGTTTQKFTFGAGLQAELSILNLVGIGVMGMFYLPSADPSSLKSSKAWAVMPYGKLRIPLALPVITPYVLAEIGIGQIIPSTGPNVLELPMGGGIGGELKVGPVGIYLDIDYLYRKPLQKKNNRSSSWHGLGVNVGAMLWL